MSKGGRLNPRYMKVTLWLSPQSAQINLLHTVHKLSNPTPFVACSSQSQKHKHDSFGMQMHVKAVEHAKSPVRALTCL